MSTPERRRWWVEIGLGAVCLVALALTAAWPEWIEEIFGVDPDGGSGALEWALVALLAVFTIGFEWHGVRGLRRTVTASESS